MTKLVECWQDWLELFVKLSNRMIVLDEPVGWWLEVWCRLHLSGGELMEAEASLSRDVGMK